MIFTATKAFHFFKPPSVDPTVSKIEAFADLAKGWNFGEGTTPSRKAIARALDVLNLMKQLGYTETDAFPGYDGEIAVTAYKNEFFLHFVVEEDDLASLRVKRGEETIVRHYHISELEAWGHLIAATGVVWGISERSTSKSTTIAAANDSTHWHFESPKGQEFHYSVANA